MSLDSHFGAFDILCVVREFRARRAGFDEKTESITKGCISGCGIVSTDCLLAGRPGFEQMGSTWTQGMCSLVGLKLCTELPYNIQANVRRLGAEPVGLGDQVLAEMVFPCRRRQAENWLSLR